MIFKKNVWIIFYFIFIVAFSFYSLLLYFRYYEIEDRRLLSYKYYTEIIAQATNSIFTQEEMLLNTLGNQLLKNSAYKNVEDSKKILDSLLIKDSLLLGFGLADIEGNILLTSTNIKLPKNANLLKNETTKDSFKEVLYSDSIVVGRAMFMKSLSKWVIPLRKAIRDTNGNIIGVINAAMDHNSEYNFLSNLTSAKNKSVMIIKDSVDTKGFYKLYDSSKNTVDDEFLYSRVISKKIINSSIKSIEKKYNLSIDDLRNTNQIIVFKIKDMMEKEAIIGLTYNKKYRLWCLVKNRSNEIYSEFLSVLIVYSLIFIFSFIVFYLLFKNIATSEKRKNDALVFQTLHDTLTLLPNRSYMYKNINRWSRYTTNGYYVLFIDLDNFKNINDKLGHMIGDDILVEVANRLRSYFTEGEMIVRQGGDEFIILKKCKNEKILDSKFLELINEISKTYHIDNKEFRVGLSIGISVYPKDAQTIEELLSLADTAMYEAKKRKNSYCFFSEKMRHNNILKADIEQELRSAIEKNELWMAYQPQINVDGSIHGVEALARWENEKLGFVGPDKFIVVAEETGLMRGLGEFIITTSLRDIKKIQSELNIMFNLSINISVVQLMEADFLEHILQLIENEKFDKSMLTLEITESLSIEDLDEVLPLLLAIRENGIEISLDDFGTGYSSLSILKKLPINELKIDKSFIDEILYDTGQKALVQSIINIGKNFNMKTLAEGVETEEQVAVLKNHMCDIFQGYYFSKPLSNNNLLQYLKHNK
ncbi:EAL domain-containing protein [Candidatus Sulfurimonas marisnigri]|uniref:EAL domain-containing protein n=1 Tax=Candidatus Sulfurimonas marisnigri TaxID=2740405 RepID=A0A7S7LYC4_9BACT|nr:EAL domain-containing protein [Candidatus Sulfurimonas marisnigri]QOY53676.1 EAL domain-containing protein [Candidatus Sulfurimonas marisnigri]